MHPYAKRRPALAAALALLTALTATPSAARAEGRRETREAKDDKGSKESKDSKDGKESRKGSGKSRDSRKGDSGKGDGGKSDGGKESTGKESGDGDERSAGKKRKGKAAPRYRMDFDKAELSDVLKYVAEWTGRNFILPENVKGKISITGPTEVTAEEAYDAFIAALESNNLTTTPTGKFLKVVPKKDSIRTPIDEYLGRDGPIHLNERMVTRLIRIKHAELDPIKGVVSQFITKEGEVLAHPPDFLFVSDDAQNIPRIEKIVGLLDKPGTQDEVNVIPVSYASAQEMANILTQVFTAPAGGGTRKSTAPAPGKDAPAAAPAPTAAPTGTSDSRDSGSVTKILHDERTNKLIVIAGARTFARVQEMVRLLDVPTDSSQVHVYYLENADAEELATTLGSLASGSTSTKKKGSTPTPAAGAPTPPPPAGAAGAASAALFSGEVKVTAEKSTNALLIIASPADYRNMVRVIQQLDIRRRQVFIEAVIMEVKLNGENKLGVDLHSGYAFTDVQLPGTDKGIAPLVVGSEVSTPGASLSLAGLASMSGFLAGLQGPPIKVDGLNLSLPSFGVVVNALQKNSDVNVISTPHVLTSDNEDAEISVGSSVPFQTAVAGNVGGLGSLAGLAGAGATGLAGTTGQNTAGLLGGLGGLGLGGFGFGGIVPIQRQPVELRLKIKPQINESDMVKLQIDEQVEEISSIDPQRGPTTAKRSVKTTVVARDQTTVVIGGLIQERMTRGETKVPVLGSLPLVGALFRNTSQIRERTNLLLFLTPYIIRDQSDFRRIFERKMKERQEFVARFFGATEQYAATIDYSRKQGPLAHLRASVRAELSKAENGGEGAGGERIIRPSDTRGTEKPAGEPTAPVRRTSSTASAAAPVGAVPAAETAPTSTSDAAETPGRPLGEGDSAPAAEPVQPAEPAAGSEE